jgi:hypothetical protein
MEINPWKSIHEKSIHGNQFMGINPWESIHEKSFNKKSIKKKPLSGLISNVLVFFNFLDEFFHEDQ